MILNAAGVARIIYKNEDEIIALHLFPFILFKKRKNKNGKIKGKKKVSRSRRSSHTTRRKVRVI